MNVCVRWDIFGIVSAKLVKRNLLQKLDTLFWPTFHVASLGVVGIEIILLEVYVHSNSRNQESTAIIQI